MIEHYDIVRAECASTKLLARLIFCCFLQLVIFDVVQRGTSVQAVVTRGTHDHPASI